MRRHLLLGTVALTLVAIAVFALPAAISVRDAERSVQVIELQSEAIDAAAALGRGGDRAEGEASEEQGEGEDDGDEGPGETDHAYGRYGVDGRLVDGTGPATADEVVAGALAGTASTGRVGGSEVAAVPLPDGGAVRVAEEVGESDAATRRAVGSLALVALVVVLAATAAAWILSSRLVRPLEALRRSAAGIGAGGVPPMARTDIREIDEVSEALEASSERVASLVARERRLTGDISHQLRTPLAGLRVALEAEVEAPRPERQAILREALGAVDRMDASVAALLTLAREEPGGRSSDLGGTVEAAGARWEDAYARAGRPLLLRVRPAPMSALRPEAAATVLDVLLENALAHGHGTVVVRVDPVEGGVRVTVGDEGTCALDPEEAFTRRRSGADGTGIGLDLARRLAEADGARLRMASRAPTCLELVAPTLGLGPTPQGTADRSA